MKIAIDARTVSDNKTGIGNYINNICEKLPVIDKNNVYVYYQEKLRHGLKKIPVISIISRLLYFIYDNFIFPFRLIFDKIAIYHHPAFILPLLNFGYKKIITIHDLGFYVFGKDFATSWHARHLRFMLPRSLKKADKIIAVSEATKRQIMDIFHLPAEKIVVIYEGVSAKFKVIQDRVEVAKVLEKYGLKQPYILFVGTMDPRKNVKRLLEAFLQIKQEFPELSLVLAGARGYLFDKNLQYLIERGEIIAPGYICEEDLVCFYNGAKAFAFPSLYEGFGLPILEAMACGTPVLTSNRYSMPEVAGDSAVLVNPENIEELAAGLKALLGNSSLRDELRTKGLARVREFTWGKAACHTLAVYNEVTGEK